MKKTKAILLYPWMKGLDKTSIPGTQDPRALSNSKNAIITNRGSVRKKPGVTRIPYTGKDDGRVQMATHFFATSGGAQRNEVVRVRDGYVETIRDGMVIDLGLRVSPTDTVTSERFGNTLLLFFENTRPKSYTIGGSSLTDIEILGSHEDIPPSFSRKHLQRLYYSGIGDVPHRVYASAVNDFNDYALLSGGFLLRVEEGDGDPIGVTGLSPTFRGDMYITKYNSIHRLYRAAYGFALDTISEEVGCVHHNAMAATQNDIFMVSHYAIHSLVATDKYGAAEEYTVSYPIFEFFQDLVNWGASKYIQMHYDSISNNVMISLPSAGSAFPDTVLNFNSRSKEFTMWENTEYPTLGRYFDFGRRKTMVSKENEGIGIFDADVSTEFGDPVPFIIKTGLIFPFGNPKVQSKFEKLWILMKPTLNTATIQVRYYIDAKLTGSQSFNTDGGTDDAVIGESAAEAIIGTDLIGINHEDLLVLEMDLVGEGASIEFEILNEPDEGSPDEPVEVFGLVYEIDGGPDRDETVKI